MGTTRMATFRLTVQRYIKVARLSRRATIFNGMRKVTHYAKMKAVITASCLLFTDTLREPVSEP